MGRDMCRRQFASTSSACASAANVSRSDAPTLLRLERAACAAASGAAQPNRPHRPQPLKEKEEAEGNGISISTPLKRPPRPPSSRRRKWLRRSG